LSPIRILPRQAIVFSGRADNTLRVLIYSAVVVYFRRILFLGFRVTSANGYRIQLVRPDTPVQDLSPARLRIEMPFSGLLHDRHRCGPFLVSDGKDCTVWMMGIDFHTHFLLSQRGKLGARVFILDVVSGGDKI